MSKSSPLLATVFGLAFTASSAYAETGQYGLGSAQSSYSAAVADGVVANPAAALSSSAAQLSALLQEWDRAGFSAPSKPAQALVYGRNGRVTSGGTTP